MLKRIVFPVVALPYTATPSADVVDDDIGEGHRAADRVRLGPVEDRDAVSAIAHGERVSGIVANPVPCHRVEAGSRVGDRDPGRRRCLRARSALRRAGVAGVDADPIRLGADRDPDPVVAVGQHVRAGDVDADQVTGDDVANWSRSR